MLTDKAIKALRAAEKPYKAADGKGLYLHVQPSGARWWRLKYRFQGREKLLSLGTYPEVSLAKARDRRDEARRLVADGIDPSEARKAEKRAQADSFEAIAREWMAKQKRKLAPATYDKAEWMLREFVFPYVGRTPINSINPPQLLAVLRRVESQGKHETAHRVRQRCGQIFRYAIATGRAERDPAADLKGALAPISVKHRAAITEPRRVGELLRAVDGYTGQLATRNALQLLALTFVRPGELRLATWAEFELDRGLWRIPAERTKMRREHLVPLSRQAVEVLEEIHPLTERKTYAFESPRPGRPLSDNTMNAALRGLGYPGDVMTAHGFRSTASTLLHELGWPPEVIELQLAHAQRSQVAAAYNRSARLEERTRMMQSWADYLDSLRRDSKVVTLRSAT